MDSELEMIPKYYAIKNIILDEIKSGILKKGELIPSEKVLQEKFGVSRITVKRALDELASEGYLYRVQGKGTFVQNDKAKTIPFSKKMVSCSDEIRKIHMVPSRKAVISEVKGCNKEVAEELGLEIGEPVLHFARIYYADRTPINYSDGYINLKDLDGLEKYDLEHNSLMHIIQNNYGLDIEMIKSDAEAVCSSGKLSEMLDIDDGFPLIKLSTLSGYKRGTQRYCETVISYYRTDLLKISIV